MAILASQTTKTVADPCNSYDSMKALWLRSRAVCNGERYVKDFDRTLDVLNFSNLLLPFSPSMTPQQYAFYRSEAELPGIVGQYAKILIGGLLRKQPTFDIVDKVSDTQKEEIRKWILSEFSEDNVPLMAFLDKVLWEEVQTSRAWVFVDYPVIEDADKLTNVEKKEFKPFPVILNAESLINWRVSTSKDNGSKTLTRLVVRSFVEKYTDKNEFHPELVDTICVHELDENGDYQVRVFEKQLPEASKEVINGRIQQEYHTPENKGTFKEVKVITNILANGKRLRIIPAWPLNSAIDPVEPILTPLIDREISLYNKVSRRNHLLYGAATYTPVIMSDMTDEEFEDAVSSGLGSWIHLKAGDDIKALETPTAALVDMDRAIAATIEEMARMGVRMLSPENGDQSGIALELRNAAQTAQLGTLNTKISNQMADIIAFMINWRYDLDLSASDIKFELSSDFNPGPVGADWLRLATEWYQSGLIPRSVWLIILKQNDIIPPDYNDEQGQEEINGDEMIVNPREQADTATQMSQAELELKKKMMGKQ